MTAQPSLRRSLRTVRKSARRAVMAEGGLGPALRKVLGIWRGHGLVGLRRGLALLSAQAELPPTREADGHDQHDYRAWVRRYDSMDENLRASLLKSIARLTDPPLISVVLLAADASPAQPEQTEQTLGSLRAQIYPHWELCQGPAQAKGEAVALVRAGDILPAHALLCLAKALLDQPQAQVFYADEDSLDASGQRSQPQFKPDANPELMLAVNLFTGLLACRTPLLQQVGGLAWPDLAAYDLALRAVEAVGWGAVAHIPRVLCHRRQQGGGDNAELGRRVVQGHLSRTGRAAEVVAAPELPLARRVIFPRPGNDRLVSILIPTKDRADLLGACVRSLLDQTRHQGFEIIILDNGSQEDATFRLFDSLPRDRVRVLPDAAPFNFSRLNNLGAHEARGEFLCLLNNDIEVMEPDWLGEMLSFAVQPEVGCVGARLWYPDDTLQHGGILVGLGGSAGHAHRCLPRGQAGYFGRAVLHQSLSAVTAACLVVRKGVFDQVGGLDEDLPESYNDVDFCLRVQEAGYRNVWTPYAELKHYESASRRNRPSDYAAKMKEYDRQASLIMRTRRSTLREDPAYNPNLTRLGDDFGLAWPPRVPPLDLL